MTRRRHAPFLISTFVKQASGDTTELHLDVYATMVEVKRAVHDALWFPVNSQQLIFAGKLLEDGRTLQDYCIQRGSTLHLVVKKVRDGYQHLFGDDGKLLIPWEPLLKWEEWPEERCMAENWKTSVMDVVKGVKKLNVFSVAFAQRLFEEIDNFCEARADSGLALRMEHLKLDKKLEELLEPVVKHVVKNNDAKTCLLIKAMRYAWVPNKVVDWPLHCDGDMATLNVCLGNSHEGGLLRIV